ncbi:S1C family serine protease [Antrihabitans sp. YC2-6]|uniref:S1C family serine protease n=1 Tax=Antrihabitans sp. YC2-6 TaxID=2799498 RepID=UPI0018F5CE06|nr:trypsin-like peptidase domain-containing protein [Antrihabitans sp. YC2-6]MBJ8347818.1 trypsin-like peptidase domain-containing protein [Antrihabitans sp. YC2-6]
MDGEERPDVGRMWVPPQRVGPQRIQPEPRSGGFARVIVTVLVLAGVVGGLGLASDQWDLGKLFDGRPGSTSDARGALPVEVPKPPLDVNAVAAAVNPTIVNINVTVGPLELEGAGTGIMLTPDGQVLTSHHVIKGAVTISVTDVGNGLIYDATPVGYDSSHDIALLQLVNAADLPAARIGDSETVDVGDEVVAIGNAGGVGGTPTVSPGRTTDLDGSIVARNESDYSRKVLNDLIEIEAEVRAGQSGGALVNSTGEVVGVITAASLNPEAENIESTTPTAVPGSGPVEPVEPTQAYAVPIDQAMQIVAQIRSGQRTDTVHIGPTATLGALVSNDDRGARVEVAIYGTPAYEAGLRSGDVITAVDEQPIDSSTALRIELNGRTPGDALRLAVTDEAGASRIVSVTLADGPPN